MCLGSLIWWASFWADFGVVINSVIIGLYVLTASIIAIQLYRTAELAREERIAASRTVYYLAVGTILMVSLDTPFLSDKTNICSSGNGTPLLG